MTRYHARMCLFGVTKLTINSPGVKKNRTPYNCLCP